MAQQGTPPRRSARRGVSGRPVRPGGPGGPGGPGWPERPARTGRAPRPDHRDGHYENPWETGSFPADTDPDLPPWAGPGIYARQAGRRSGPPASPDPVRQPGGRPGEDGGGVRRRGRAAAARLRKSRRRVLIRGGAAVVVAVVIALVLILRQQHSPAPASSFVTALQPGEFRGVPSACSVVSPATLSHYLPGTPKVLKSISTAPESQCSYTVDARPVFRVLEVTVQALQPRVLAAGDGSATYNAIFSYFQARQALARPPKKAPLPRAQITQVTGLGQAALSAIQVSHSGGATMDLATVLARDRNALVTVTLEGQARGGGFGPVSIGQLRSGALAAARQALAAVTAGPVVSS